MSAQHPAVINGLQLAHVAPNHGGGLIPSKSRRQNRRELAAYLDHADAVECKGKRRNAVIAEVTIDAMYSGRDVVASAIGLAQGTPAAAQAFEAIAMEGVNQLRDNVAQTGRALR